MKVAPSGTAYSWMLEGEALLRARRMREAIDRFQSAESLGADADRCSAGRWTAKMLVANFEEAWRESDAIRRRGAVDPHRFWRGEPLAGRRVMLRFLHGYGDAVQFLQYAPHLRDLTSRLIVEVAPRFRELASCFDGVEEVITWGEDAPHPSPNWDVQMECIELPYVFRTQRSDLPVATNYLKLPQGGRPTVSAESWRRGTPRVGLVWTAGSWNPQRSIPAKSLEPLLHEEECEFWDLQGGPERAEADADVPSVMMHEEKRCRDDIMALAKTISRLDLLISVDTLAVHLAGALGVPAWLLLPYEADWRWLHDREDSPWYPTLRLFRQPTPGDWESVIRITRRALRKWSRSACLETVRR